MSRCVCYTSALELFVKHLAGWNIRQQRARQFFRQCRPFGTRPSLWHPETRSVAERDQSAPAEKDAFPSQTTETPRTRAQSRMLRKLKRIEEGKYAASATERSRQQHAYSSNTQGHLIQAENGADKREQSHVDSVMMKIDKLPGASMQMQKASRKERQVQKCVEKRKKLQRLRAQERLEEAETRKRQDKERKMQLLKSGERWKVEKEALSKKFGETGWQPRKRLSPDSLEGIRALHASDPAVYSTATLAQNFEVSPESIRRILRSKWKPSEDERAQRMERWERRGFRKWEDMAEQGMKPPKKWREMGVKNPVVEGKRIRKQWEDSRKAEPVWARYKKRKPAAVDANEEPHWERELTSAQTPQDLMNLADRIM